MSYLVLARKYRPQTFDDIVGQDHVTRTLKNAIKSDRVAHAFLFTGTRGVGKTTAARVLAKALNCEKGPAEEPCNECTACKAVTAGNAVDVFEIDGASNTGVDDVRQLRENVKFMPQSARFKVYIIDEVHMLTTNAFNALLKTLEEPPDHVIFIMATTEVHKIPETVLSRSQQYDFKMISMRAILEHLQKLVNAEKIEFDEGALRLIARKAEGSMRDALSFLDQALSFAGEKAGAAELAQVLGIVDREILLDLSEAILAGNGEGVLGVMERLQAVAWDVKSLYGDLLEHFRNLIVAKVSKKPEAMIDTTTEELSRLGEQSKKVTHETLQRLFSILMENEDLTLRSAYPRLVLEMTLLQMAYASPVASLDELVGKLAEFKGGIPGGTPRPFQETEPAAQGERPPAKPEKPASKPPKKTEPASRPKAEPKTPAPLPTPPPKAERASQKIGSENPEPVDPPKEPVPVEKPTGIGDIAEQFIEAIREENRLLAAIFEGGEFLGYENDTLTIGIEKLMSKQVKTHRKIVNEAARKVCGEKTKVKLTEIDPKDGQVDQGQALRDRAERSVKLVEVRKEARKHELVKTITDLFGNTQVDVVPIETEE
jgi:DNA polymerase III subunit gamma/tau